MNLFEEKEQLIDLIADTRNKFLNSDIKYKETKCRLLLETDFATILNKSRPTVDDKKAYVDLNTLDLKKEKESLAIKIKTLELKLDLLNNKIDFELKE